MHCVRTKGREYFYFQPFRGTKRAAERRRLPGHPINPDGTLNTEWWTLYKQLAGSKNSSSREVWLPSLRPTRQVPNGHRTLTAHVPTGHAIWSTSSKRGAICRSRGSRQNTCSIFATPMRTGSRPIRRSAELAHPIESGGGEQSAPLSVAKTKVSPGFVRNIHAREFLETAVIGHEDIDPYVRRQLLLSLILPSRLPRAIDRANGMAF